MRERGGEIHLHGRVYTYSRHLRDNLHRHPEATEDNVGHVLLNPARRDPDGDRRIVYWSELPHQNLFMKVVVDRLPTGEFQVLSAYCPLAQPTREEIYGQEGT